MSEPCIKKNASNAQQCSVDSQSSLISPLSALIPPLLLDWFVYLVDMNMKVGLIGS